MIAATLRLQEGQPPRTWWGRLTGASPLSAESRSWYRGAVGEIAVGQILGRLGPAWTVLHAVPVGAGASDIDHVLIGPAGVFTLNTKNHSGKTVWVADRAIRVDGHQQHYLSHSRHEAARAAKRLSAVVGEPVPVTPVLLSDRSAVVRRAVQRGRRGVRRVCAREPSAVLVTRSAALGSGRFRGKAGSLLPVPVSERTVCT
ncbi:nuclease-related domain-containing protein [Kocuria sp. NPDC057446]|uniref:nuclease-related domain-containing protein n=1 Tax=Kocuria sp. NPDC057446 TaxID=3346137 RepID=UPI0036B1942A